jgi:hypothetical protein
MLLSSVFLRHGLGCRVRDVCIVRIVRSGGGLFSIDSGKHSILSLWCPRFGPQVNERGGVGCSIQDLYVEHSWVPAFSTMVD